jgi:predicted transglutaminase-like cysteine proteinase
MVRKLTWRAAIAPVLSATLLVMLLAAPVRVMASERAELARLTDPLVGGRTLVLTSFSTVPAWDRVRQFMLTRDNRYAPPMRALLLWAIGLRSKPVAERLQAINSRVNADFVYESDRTTWRRDDYWATPLENIEKRRMDCEDFASLKLYLAYLAGVDPDDLALLAGRIRSSGEDHVVLWARANGQGYVLDNRLPYVVASGSYTDFTVLFSVSLERLQIYRDALPAKMAKASRTAIPLSRSKDDMILADGAALTRREGGLAAGYDDYESYAGCEAATLDTVSAQPAAARGASGGCLRSP